MVDGNHVAIAPLVALQLHHRAVTRSKHLGTDKRSEIDAAMVLRHFVNWIGTITEKRGNLTDVRFLDRNDGWDARQHLSLVAGHGKQLVV